MLINSKTRFANINSLYRAKAIGDRQGKWIEGYYVRGALDSGKGYYTFTHMIYSNEVEMLTSNGIPVYDWCEKVDECTVRVFTGIFLEGTVKLWEGNYVLYQNTIYHVRYDALKGSFYLYNPAFSEYDERKYLYISTLSFLDIVNLKIVGNDVDDDIEDIRKSVKPSNPDNTIKDIFDEAQGGKVFPIYDSEGKVIGKYTVGDNYTFGYEPRLNDSGYVQYDEFLKELEEAEKKSLSESQ